MEAFVIYLIAGTLWAAVNRTDYGETKGKKVGGWVLNGLFWPFAMLLAALNV